MFYSYRLSVFAANIIHKARKHIVVNNDIEDKVVKWIISNQDIIGSFTDKGDVIGLTTMKVSKGLPRSILIDFSLTVKATPLIFISERVLAISSAKQGESGSIYNLVKN